MIAQLTVQCMPANVTVIMAQAREITEYFIDAWGMHLYLYVALRKGRIRSTWGINGNKSAVLIGGTAGSTLHVLTKK